MTTELTKAHAAIFEKIHERSDRIMKYTLWAYFAVGLVLALFYDTYFIALTVGGLSLAAYFLTKILLPASNLSRYVLSVVLGVFSAQYIYQMHGLFEMHFFFFVASALLITYQNWRLQLPLLLFVLIHHGSFAYLQYSGMQDIYFTQLDYMDLQTFLFHGVIAGIIIFICGYWSYDLEKKTLREGSTLRALEQQLKNIDRNMAFANAISQGNLNFDFQSDENDPLSQSLLRMKDSLMNSSRREQEERFMTAGEAMVGEILRKNSQDINLLSEELTRAIVKYVQANQGALFLLAGDGEHQYLEMKACYAYERKKFLEKRVDIGSGLVGQCFLEREVTLLTDVPDQYIHITSGLGAANPRSVVLVPLMTNDTVQGVIELAAFHRFTEAEIRFLQKIGESIASSIISTQTTEKIKILLEESQMRGEAMRAQEEEMRQNMEELNAVQEQLSRQLEEAEIVRKSLEARVEMLSAATLYTETDLQGNIIHANPRFCEVTGYKAENIAGLSHSIVRHPDTSPDVFKRMWQTLREGKTFRGTLKNRRRDGSPYWAEVVIAPIRNPQGEIIRYASASHEINDTRNLLEPGFALERQN